MVQRRIITIFIFTIAILSITYAGFTQDGTSTRPNTLFDEVDDIQAQLDNEARDKMIYGKPKTIFIFRLPTGFPLAHTKPVTRYSRNNATITHIVPRRVKQKKTKKPSTITKDWSYKDQREWYKTYPSCGGRSQSPVDLPSDSLVKAAGCRPLSFINYNVLPQSLTLTNDGKRVVLYGSWESSHQPVVYGGAAHSRRYLFHSMTLHWPSEHRIGGFLYPLESQVLHFSAEYKTLKNAINASSQDSLALLGIVNLYKFRNSTQRGINELLRIGYGSKSRNVTVSPLPLSYFNPPMRHYACYQGSLTTPPCTESVLWLVRGRALAVSREAMDMAYKILGEGELRGALNRQTQPLNDRKVCYF